MAKPPAADPHFIVTNEGVQPGNPSVLRPASAPSNNLFIDFEIDADNTPAQPDSNLNKPYIVHVTGASHAK